MERIKIQNIESSNETLEAKKINTMRLGNIDDIYKNIEEGIAPTGAKQIIDVFKQNNSLEKTRILISGGFVRDILLGESPKDIDFVTNLTYDKVKTLLENNLQNIKKIEAQGQTFQVVRIVFENGEEYEIATFRMDGEYKDGVHPETIVPITSPGIDAMRRDFTINALFYNPLSGNVIDYVGGLLDISEKRLRFVGNPEERIKEDKSRMLRYARFILKTNFSINEKDKEAIRKHSSEINNIPKELLKKELDKMIKLSNGKNIIELLDELNLLENIFPELKELEMCEQGAPYHMEGNVLIHTKMTCENLPENADPILKWAAMFHDIGKSETRKSEIKNGKEKISFVGHDEIGAEKASHILKRLKFSRVEIKEISWIIKNHLRIFMQIFDFIENNNEETARIKSVKAIKKLIKQSSEKQVERLMDLAYADSESSIQESGNNNKKHFEKIFNFFEDAKKEIENENKKGIDIEKIVNGRIIMEELNLKSGSEIGKIKKQIIGELSELDFETKEEAEKKFLEILKKLK